MCSSRVYLQRISVNAVPSKGTSGFAGAANWRAWLWVWPGILLVFLRYDALTESLFPAHSHSLKCGAV